MEQIWNLLGFVDNNPEVQGKNVDDYAVLGTSDCVEKYHDAYFVCAIGSAKTRKAVIEKLGNVKFATLIDPSVIISKNGTIEEGAIICGGTIITIDITIGRHVFEDISIKKEVTEMVSKTMKPDAIACSGTFGFVHYSISGTVPISSEPFLWCTYV